MTADLLLALAGFAIVSTGTPGPNNMMLLASGANYGYRRSLPHMAGIWLGLASMIGAMGIGLGQLFALWPQFHIVLKVLSSGYLIWLAWKIATAAAPKGAEGKGRPFTTFEAAVFQWVNPKAWAMALTAVSVYLPAPGFLGVAVVALAFTLAAFPTNSLWTLLGQEMARFLTSDTRRRAFNWTMATLLVASLYPVLRG